MQFYFFYFLQNITQSIVPNIEKFAIQQTVLECSDCEIQIKKV